MQSQNAIDMRTALLEMSARDFESLGTGMLAYMRPFPNGVAIYSADGAKLGFSASTNDAYASILRNNLQPVTVH